jgi:hypothetical protein
MQLSANCKSKSQSHEFQGHIRLVSEETQENGRHSVFLRKSVRSVTIVHFSLRNGGHYRRALSVVSA